MNIFDFALQMELDGEKYYRHLAEKAKYDDLKKVLEGLADDEQRHYQIIQLAQSQNFKHIAPDPSLSKIQNVFVSSSKSISSDNKEIIAKLKDEQLDVYREALIKEKESVALYRQLQEKAQNQDEKEIFGKLMEEEEKHVDVLDTIIELLNHTSDWVESAEFNHTKPY